MAYATFLHVLKPFLPFFSAILGGVFGYYAISDSGGVDLDFLPWLAGWDVRQFFEDLGESYLRMLIMCVIPIIFAAIIKGFADLFNSEEVTKKGFRIFVVVVGSMLVVCVLGMFSYLIVDNLSRTDIFEIDRAAVGGLLSKASEGGDIRVISYQNDDGGFGYIKPYTFKDYFPENIFDALSNFYAIQLVIFSMLTGLMIGLILKAEPEKNPKKREAQVYVKDIVTKLLDLIRATYEIFMSLSSYLLRFLPIALFLLLASLVASEKESIVGIFKATAVFVVSFYVFGTFVIIVCSVMVWWFSGRVNGLLKSIGFLMAPVQTSFFTMSSFVAMPVAIDTLSNRFNFNETSVRLYMTLFLPLLRFGNIFYFIMAASFFLIVFQDSTNSNWMTLGLQASYESIAPSFATIGTTSIVAIQPIRDVFTALSIPGITAAILLLMAVDSIIDPMRTTLIVHCNTALVAALSEKDELN